jgi:hypothetical protein
MASEGCGIVEVGAIMKRLRAGTRHVRALAAASIMTVVLATACAKTAEEETRLEILEGSSQSVSILGGFGANAGQLARTHCSRYQKQAVLRDAEPAGDQIEALATGSRPYLYRYDCL